MSTSSDFGELRSLLTASPSAEAFGAVIDHIEAALPELGEQAYLDQWHAYAEKALASWPDEVRIVEGERLKALESTPASWGLLVRALDYTGVAITPPRCEALCAAGHLANVSRLDLSNASTRWTVLRDLADGAPFVLDMFGLRKSTSSGAAPKDLVPLFTSRMLSQVEELRFTWWTRFGAKSMKTLLEELPLGRLRVLDLYETGIGKTGLKALFQCEELTALEHLDLGLVEANAKLWKLFAQASFPELQTLGVTVGRDDVAAFTDFIATCNLPKLREIRLSRYTIDLDAARAAAPEGVSIERVKIKYKPMVW